GTSPKKPNYRIEYAITGRAKCKGPKPCQGISHQKGQPHVGPHVGFQGNPSFAWRHWGCTTSKVFTNMKNILNGSDKLNGFKGVCKAWEDGCIKDESVNVQSYVAHFHKQASLTTAVQSRMP
ncbi:hypothetical protein BXZ70DRAFT_903063, partial [Cristinia sonorae]